MKSTDRKLSWIQNLFICRQTGYWRRKMNLPIDDLSKKIGNWSLELWLRRLNYVTGCFIKGANIRFCVSRRWLKRWRLRCKHIDFYFQIILKLFYFYLMIHGKYFREESVVNPLIKWKLKKTFEELFFIELLGQFLQE